MDRNRIKSVDFHSFATQWSLQELHIEENRLKDLGGLVHVQNMERLYMGMNRIQVIFPNKYVCQQGRLCPSVFCLTRIRTTVSVLQDLTELEKREVLPNLVEISVISNPVSSSPSVNSVCHRPDLQVLEQVPRLLSLVFDQVARRLMHRPLLVYRIPTLVVIDGIPVSDEERTKAEIYFFEQQVC